MAAFYKVSKDGKRVEPNFSAWVRPNITFGPLYHKSPGAPLIEVNKHVNVQANHAELIREVAAKSTVLLKNERGALPLRRPATMAVIGEDAQDAPGGPNACDDNRCYRGTLTMGYGSATAYYPWVVSPHAALRARAAADGTALVNVATNWDLAAARAAAAGADVALVFASATSGENFITIDGNAGDRNNLTLWNGGDALVRAVAAVHPNVVVVLHTVGPVLLDYAAAHPNISAIVWAGLPGQESGPALVDVLYGAVNPQGHSPFTWARAEADYGPRLLYTSNAPRPPPGAPVGPPGSGPGPWQEFPEGVFIDYRHFQRARIEPLWEFGFGLSYTDFRYENLSVVAATGAGAAAKGYAAATGTTGPAATFGAVNRSVEANTEPRGFVRVKPYVYPWVNSTFRAGPVGGGVTPGRNGSAQPVAPAGGAPGGHRGLYEEVYKVEFTVKNLGKVAGADVPQLVSRPSLRGDWWALPSFHRWPFLPFAPHPNVFGSKPVPKVLGRASSVPANSFFRSLVCPARRRREPVGCPPRFRRCVPRGRRGEAGILLPDASRHQQLGRSKPELDRQPPRQDRLCRLQLNAHCAERNVACAQELTNP